MLSIESMRFINNIGLLFLTFQMDFHKAFHLIDSDYNQLEDLLQTGEVKTILTTPDCEHFLSRVRVGKTKYVSKITIDSYFRKLYNKCPFLAIVYQRMYCDSVRNPNKNASNEIRSYCNTLTVEELTYMLAGGLEMYGITIQVLVHKISQETNLLKQVDNIVRSVSKSSYNPLSGGILSSVIFLLMKKAIVNNDSDLKEFVEEIIEIHHIKPSNMTYIPESELDEELVDWYLELIEEKSTNNGTRECYYKYFITWCMKSCVIQYPFKVDISNTFRYTLKSISEIYSWEYMLSLLAVNNDISWGAMIKFIDEALVLAFPYITTQSLLKCVYDVVDRSFCTYSLADYISKKYIELHRHCDV